MDILTVITDKLLRAGLSHLDCYLQVKKDLTDSNQLETTFLQYYGIHIHVAARSRKYELKYLQKLCQQVMQHLLPEKTLECKYVMNMLHWNLLKFSSYKFLMYRQVNNLVLSFSVPYIHF